MKTKSMTVIKQSFWLLGCLSLLNFSCQKSSNSPDLTTTSNLSVADLTNVSLSAAQISSGLNLILVVLPIKEVPLTLTMVLAMNLLHLIRHKQGCLLAMTAVQILVIIIINLNHVVLL